MKKKTVLKKTFNLIYNTVFRKLIKMWHNTDIRLVTTKEKKHYLVSELNYQTAKKNFWKFISHSNKKTANSYE